MANKKQYSDFSSSYEDTNNINRINPASLFIGMDSRETTDMNMREKQSAIQLVINAIDILLAGKEPITPTTVSRTAGVHRSYIYKNKTIKALIDSYRTYNEEIAASRSFITSNHPKRYENTNRYKEDLSLITYQLHMKLMESYIHEYQLLKYQNSQMEQEIEALKKELADQQ